MKCSETERLGCFRLKYIDNIKDRGLVGNLINESIPIGTLICCDGKPDQAIPKKTGQDYLRDDKIKKVVEINDRTFYLNKQLIWIGELYTDKTGFPGTWVNTTDKSEKTNKKEVGEMKKDDDVTNALGRQNLSKPNLKLKIFPNGIQSFPYWEVVKPIPYNHEALGHYGTSYILHNYISKCYGRLRLDIINFICFCVFVSSLFTSFSDIYCVVGVL